MCNVLKKFTGINPIGLTLTCGYLSRRGHQIMQIIEKDRFSLTPLLKMGWPNKYLIKSFHVMSGNFFCPAYTNVSRMVHEIIPKN